jgi:hypothetical protein
MARKPIAKPRAVTPPQPSDEMHDETQGMDEVQRRIAVAAYYRAEQRGFEPGHELEDWIAAEKEVRRGTEGRA